MRQPPFLAWPGWHHLRFAWVLSVASAAWFAWVYAGADVLTSHRAARVRLYFSQELSIPFVPESVVVFITLYLLFLAAPFILRERNDFFALAMTGNLVILVSGFGFLLIPAQLGYPAPKDLGVFPRLFGLVDRLNLTYDLVPSLPAALSTLCVAAFASKANQTWKFFLWIWAVAIAVSGLLMHQHHVIDVVAGIALALAAYHFIYVRRFNRG